ATLIQEEADEDANIIFGAVIDEGMGDEVRITVIATGFGERDAERAQRPGNGVERPALAHHAADGRPIRRHGLLNEADYDTPAFQRRGRETPARPAPRSPVPQTSNGNGNGDGDDEYDIPTFLRRNAD